MTDTLADLVTGGDIARRLNMSRQRVQQLAGKPEFPRPLGKVGNAKVWQWEDIAAWDERRVDGRRKQPAEAAPGAPSAEGAAPRRGKAAGSTPALGTPTTETS